MSAQSFKDEGASHWAAGRVNDTWVLDGADGLWHEPTISGSPPSGRSFHGCVALGARGARDVERADEVRDRSAEGKEDHHEECHELEDVSNHCGDHLHLRGGVKSEHQFEHQM